MQDGCLVYEYNHLCKCSKTCPNRVLQNGLKVKLEVFKTEKKVVTCDCFHCLDVSESIVGQILIPIFWLLFDRVGGSEPVSPFYEVHLSVNLSVR